MWGPLPVYIKIKRNSVEVTNLETGESVKRTALQSFSTERILIGNFGNAEDTVRAGLDDLLPPKKLLGIYWRHSYKILIQQLQAMEGGLSELEIRAIPDLAEQSGGRKVYVLENDIPLTTDAAASYLKALK